MSNPNSPPRIRDSYFEHERRYADAWVDQWILPNPFISAVLPPLRKVGVELADISFSKDPANLNEINLNIALRRLSAGIRISLDTVTYVVANPTWDLAPDIAAVFDLVATQVEQVAGAMPERQEATLAFHVTPGGTDFSQATASLVDLGKVGEALFHGVSLHWPDGSLIIDKSAKYDAAAFVRVQIRFGGDATFAEILARIYKEEVAALKLLSIHDVPLSM